MQTAYKYPERAFIPLPCGGRALRPNAELEPAVERARGGEPRAPTHRTSRRILSGYGISAADQEAVDRETGGPTTTLAPRRNSRCLSERHQSATARSIAQIEAWLRGPATHAYGERVLVTTRVHRCLRSGPARLEVRCIPCGRKDLVNARLWCEKSEKLGKVCFECARNRRRLIARHANAGQAAQV